VTDTALLEGELRRRSNLKAHFGDEGTTMMPSLEGLSALTVLRSTGVFRGSAEGNLHLQNIATGESGRRHEVSIGVEAERFGAGKATETGSKE